LLNVEGITAADLAGAKVMPPSVVEFRQMLDDYWTPERRTEHGYDIIDYYSDMPLDTLTV
jgi:hypothetical protein